MTFTALITTPYYPPHLGGVEGYSAQLAGALADHGVRVVVVTTSATVNRLEGHDVDGVRIYRLPAPAKFSNTPFGLGWGRMLRHILDTERPDVVNAHTPVPVLSDLVARLCGRGDGEIPFVLTVHGGHLRHDNALVQGALRRYTDLVFSGTVARSRWTITSSRWVADSMLDVLGTRVSVIYPGFDPSQFSPDPSIRPNGRFLFVASLEPATSYKGLDELLVALAAARHEGSEIGLDVVGDGRARAAYQDRAQQLGIADLVRFRGALFGDDLGNAYRSAQALVLPTRFDSMPTVLLEAMACGRPVIASPVGDIPELVRPGENGLLVDPASPADLLAAMRRLGDPALADRWGRAGRGDVAAKFNWHTQGGRTLAVLRAAAENRQPRSVAVVAPYYPPKVGGVENYAHSVAREFERSADIHPIVYTVAPRVAPPDVTDHPQVRVQDGVEVRQLRPMFTLSNTPISPWWPWQFARRLRRDRVEAIFAHSPVPFFADAALIASRLPAALTFHSGSMVKGDHPADKALVAYERLVLPWLFRRALPIASSPTSLAALQPNSEVISPGVDLDTFTPSQWPDQTRPVLLYVGRLDATSRWKGVEVLVRAFARLAAAHPTAVLRLVGTGDDMPRLRGIADSLGFGDRVEFAGAIPHAALPAEYQAASLVVLPSLTAAESFGMTVAEGLACGRPVVGSAVGGIPYVLGAELASRGLLVPPGDVEALAESCSRLLSDPRLAEELGRLGRARMEAEFDWTTRTERYLELARRFVAQTTRSKAQLVRSLASWV